MKSAIGAIGGGVIAASLVAGLSHALAQEIVVEGVFALPGVTQDVGAEMVVKETGPLGRQIELTYTDLSTGMQIKDFDVELTQELHILAIHADLSTLVHRHVETVGADGSFSAELQFPHGGVYHIYADAVPAGFPQQVLRFDVPLGESAAAGKAAGPIAGAPEPWDVERGPTIASSGPYAVWLEASRLRAGQPGLVTLSVEKHGKPAADLAPYLGVAAHAVFIREEDLAYVHVHATEAGDQTGHDTHGGTPAPAHESAAAPHGSHDATGAGTPSEMPAQHAHAAHPAAPPDEGEAVAGHGEHAADHGSAGDHAAEAHPPGYAGAPEDGGLLAPEMTLHVTPPAPGIYALFIEFIGAGEVITIPFTIRIAG